VAPTHAPIMALIMIFEITLDYQIILPLMLACVVAYYTSISIEKRSIYAEALKRKGAADYRRQLAELHVRDIMKPEPADYFAQGRFLRNRREIYRNPFQLPLRH
jgi:chloride channel protein, CIC family